MDRRHFMTRFLSGCALACAGLHGVVEAAASTGPQTFGVHKFDMPYGSSFTLRDYYRLKYEEMVRMLRDLTGEIGKPQLMQMLKSVSEQRSLVLGNTRAQEVPANDFSTFVGYFRDPGYQRIMTIQIVEDTPTAFGIRITECLWASTFKALEAADIGYLMMCHADHTWAEGFNPSIRLARDQTLMQGNACCNHRYTCSA